MADLSLPGIQPARPVTGAADAIDRAGARVKAATDAVSGLMYEADLAEVAVQTQEATLGVQRGLNEALHVIQSKPYVTPAEVQDLFGGKVPSGIALDEDVFAPGQTEAKKQRRAVIPMHEVAPYLFDDRAARAVENATSGIKGEGWQKKFRMAAAADVERAREEARGWQRGQRLADLNIRSVAQYEQAAAVRAWGTAEAILNGPGMTVETREKLVAGHAQRKTQAGLQDRLRAAATPADIDAMLTDIAANDKFEAPLSADEQFRFTAAVRERGNQIEAEAAAAQKAAYKRRLDTVGNNVEAAVATAKLTGTPALSAYPGGMAKFHEDAAGLDTPDYMTLLGHMKASADSASSEPTAAGWAVYTKFAEMQKKGELVNLPVTEVFKHRADLGNKYDETLGWWRNAKEAQEKGGGPAKFALSDREDKELDNVLVGYMKLDPKKVDEFGIAKGRLISAMVAWRKEHPEETITYANVREEAARIFRHENDKDDAGARAALTAALPTLTGRIPTQGGIEAHQKAMEEQRPIVERAFESLIPKDSIVLDSGLRAEVYLLTQNTDARKILEARLRKDGNPVNDPAITYEAVRAVRDARIPAEEGRAYEAAQEEKATRAARSRDAQAAGAEIRAQDEASAAERTAESKRLTDAEQARWRALPTWEQEVELLQKRTFEDDATAVEQQVRAKVMAEDRAAQLAAAKGKGPFGGDAAIMGEWPAGHPRRIALEDRIKAETAGLLVQHRARIESQMDEAKQQYRRFLERVEAKEPAAAEAYQKFYLDSFPRWFQMRREGKVL